MKLPAKKLAEIVGGQVEGDPEVLIDRPSRIEEGGEGSISFLGHDKYEEYVYTTTASALLVSRSFKPRKPIAMTLIRVDDVYTSIAKLFDYFKPDNGRPRDISGTAIIHPEAHLAGEVALGAFAVVEAFAEIGEGTVIFPQVYIGREVRIGRNVLIYPGVRIMHRCVVGDNCVIHPNAVIGSDGFGFARDRSGNYEKIPQTGNVVLEENVEIGAGTTIDRASIGSTIIRRGAKLDNLVQIGHNVEIGENTALAAQVGIAGSTKIGKEGMIGGQAGFVGHIHVADGVRVQAQSGIASSVTQANQALFGSPAIPYLDYLRSYTLFRKLPELYRQIRELEKRINGADKRAE